MRRSSRRSRHCVGKSTVIAPRQVIELSDGQRLEDLVRFAGSTVREVGAANRTTLTDIKPDAERAVRFGHGGGHDRLQ
ncbi:MAG: hypothetical protein R3C99_24620 [Pirellulaceae bacterium]